MMPNRPELVAARVLRDLSMSVIADDTHPGFSFLPALAEAEGEGGPAVGLCVAYGLGARRSEERLAAVDALLMLAARGRLDAEQLGADLGELAVLTSVKPSRVAEAIRTAAATGAYGTAWAVLREALPPLLAELADGTGTGSGSGRRLLRTVSGISWPSPPNARSGSLHTGSCRISRRRRSGGARPGW